MSFVLARAIPMSQLNEDIRIFGAEMGGGTFGKVSRAVLAAGAAEADHQVVEFAFNIVIYCHVYDTVNPLFEVVHFLIALQIFFHAGILT